MGDNWFSNFEPFDISLEYDGLSFDTPESFYQSMKVIEYGERAKFQNMTPGEAKRYGREVDKRKDWENVKISVMRYALEYKFALGTSWYVKLDDTKGEIVEWNNWHDNFWGNCACSKCSEIDGQNWLGKLLMTIRDGEEFF